MKATIFLLFISFSSQMVYAQNVNFAWVRQIDVTSNDGGNSIAVDATGNVYITGYFGYSSSTGNAFVAKYTTSGVLLWTKQFVGTYCRGSSITIDVSGNVLTTGMFFETVDFDPGPGIFNLTATSNDEFISKLDADGNFIWAKRIGGTVFGRNVFVSSIATDLLGNVYTTGGFEGPTIDFDPGPGVYVFNSGKPWPEIFISKLDAAGNFVWAKQMEEVGVGFAPHGSWANAITVDAIGNVYTTGGFANQIDFDPGPATFYLNHTTDNWDAFISKLNTAGDFVWAKQLKGQTPDGSSGGRSIALDPSGNVYTFGAFWDIVDFDPGPGTFYLNNADAPGYISRLDAAGNFISAKSFVTGFSTIMDALGNIYTAGYFYGQVDFDPGPGIYNLNAVGMADIFISKSDNSGNFIWAKQIGGTGDDIGFSIALDASRNIYTTGYFVSTVDFDPGPGIFNLSAIGSDVFLHKMSQCINSSSSTINASACSTYTLNGQTYTATGVYLQTLINTAGCDSIIILNLTINNRYTTLSVVACDSYSWNAQTYTSSGTFRDTLPASNGCDSIVTLNLVINSKTFSFINAAICPGQDYGGYTIAGTYLDTLVAANSCDSIRTLNLSVNAGTFSTIDTTICSGRNYAGYTRSGIYIDTLVAANGCDSVRTIDLTIKNNCGIYIPNAFTPNKDGLNDLFKPTINISFQQFSFIIFNRYGQKIFETREYGKGWDGTYKGKEQPTGSYVYRITYTNISGWESVENGTVLLMR